MEAHSRALFSSTSGTVYRCFQELLEAKYGWAHDQRIHVHYTAQYIDIYNEKITDLLTGGVVTVRRDNGELVNASSMSITSMDEVKHFLHVGQERKHFATTAMNEHSSRAHTVIVLTVHQWRASTSTAAAAECRSLLYLVDLAGSERVKKSKVLGQQLKEAVGINSSLLVLGKVINALVDGKSHIPYFESKLTTLLKNAFGGNCRTVVLVHARADDHHAEETLHTLTFGERCSVILNATKVAAQSKEGALHTLQETIDKVQHQIDSLKHFRRNRRENRDAVHALEHSLAVLLQKKKDIEMLL